LFGLIGTVIGLIGMFDRLGSNTSVESLAPELAISLQCTLWSAILASAYMSAATRFEQPINARAYEYDILCNALDVRVVKPAERKLVIHGHTDDIGDKDNNLQLGYERAYAVYREIRAHSSEVPDHVVLCTHADNTPAREVPVAPQPDDAAKAAAAAARSKNR